MGINVETEKVITLGEGCREFPPNGISEATISRFIQKGVKIKALGIFVKLETVKIGGRRFTSKEAIARFIAAQNADEGTAAPAITPAQRTRQAQAAQLALQEAGL